MMQNAGDNSTGQEQLSDKPTFIDPFPEMFKQLNTLMAEVQKLNQRVDSLEKGAPLGAAVDYKTTRRAIGAEEYERLIAEGSLTREHLKVLRKACHLFSAKPYKPEPIGVPEAERDLWSDLVCMELGRRVQPPAGQAGVWCMATDMGKSVVRHDVRLRGK